MSTPTIPGVAAPGGQADPFNGLSWQQFFTSVRTSLVAAISAVQMLQSAAPLGSFAVAALPAGTTGNTAYATNGRKVGEGAGAGTGVPVYFSAGQWRVYSTDTQVLA